MVAPTGSRSGTGRKTSRDRVPGPPPGSGDGDRERTLGVVHPGPGRGRSLGPRLRHLWHQLTDGPLLHSYYALAGSVFLLAVIGAMMVLSASAVESIAEDRSAYGLFMRQGAFVVAGLVLMVGLSFVPADVYRRLAWPVWGLGVAGLLLVLTPLGYEVNGNRNWVSIGGQSFQPAEAAKLGVCLWLAARFAKQGDEVGHWKQALWPSLIGFLVPTALVMVGDDAGTALVFVMIYAAALFFAGAPLRLFAVAGAATAVLGTAAVLSAPHRLDRVTGWLFGDCGATDACWQANQGLNALATGSWWGVGLGQSRLKYSYVPEAHNDYIFSIIGEELGLVGTSVILLLFVIMVIAMARIILRTRSIFVRIASATIVTWLVGQAFVNLGMVTGLLPVIGVPLPFISYGGSALVMSLAAVGVVMAFARVPRSVRVGDGTRILDRQEAHELGAPAPRPRRGTGRREG